MHTLYILCRSRLVRRTSSHRCVPFVFLARRLQLLLAALLVGLLVLREACSGSALGACLPGIQKIKTQIKNKRNAELVYGETKITYQVHGIRYTYRNHITEF